MAETDKTFVCETAGCNLSFTNEAQLTIHKKKHDMMLNLGSSSKNSGFVADQTPTPTRFIRNCEEVGLFQDLQNVNPFEETFRRAVESGNTGTLSVPEAGITDDTLHTPHIFPHIADVLSANTQILSESPVQECSSAISITDKSTSDSSTIETEVCTSVKLVEADEQNLIKDVKLVGSKGEASLADSIITHPVSTPIVPKVLSDHAASQLSINGEEVQLLLKTSDGKLMQLSAIPINDSSIGGQAVVTRARQQQQTVVIRTEPSLQCASTLETKRSTVSRLSFAKMKLKQVLTKNTNSDNQKPLEADIKGDLSALKKENQPRTIDQMKKKEILERNRASSMRARAKRKAWIQQLQRDVTNVNETNVALQMEIKNLRAEVAKLKTLLLAHKDCPVTKAMQKGNGIVLGPKIISVNPEVVTTAPATINAPIAAVGKRSATPFSPAEVAIVPKKKAAAPKNPPIFPKVDCATTTVPIPSATLFKIMNVNHFIPEKEEPKQQQILIVQNPPQRKLDASPRQIIQINPNYEMEHAASKTTGA